MIFEGFKLHAIPTIHEAYCTNKKCKKKPELTEVSNGLLSRAWFCHACNSVYLLQLERQTKIPKEFLQKCLDEIERNYRKDAAVFQFNKEIEERKELERDNRLKKAKKFVKIKK